MLNPAFLARAGIGLAVTAVETTLALPSKVAGRAVRTYLHAEQTASGLAAKGDAVLETVFSRTSEQPEWATFDEDEDDQFVADGSVGRPDPAPEDL